MTFHQSCKDELFHIAVYVKNTFRGDKPAIREAINNHADILAREYWRHYSERQAARLADNLHTYAAKLHP